MPTTKQKDGSTGQAKKAQPESPKSSRVIIRAADHFDTVVKFVRSQGDKGATLKDIADHTGLNGRVVHNVCWRLEGSPEIHEGAKVKKGDPRKPDEIQLVRKENTGRSVVMVVAKKAPARPRKPAASKAKAPAAKAS